MKLFDYFGGALALLPHTGSAQDYAEPEGFDVHEALHSRGIHVRQLANTSSTKLAVSYEHCTAACLELSARYHGQTVIPSSPAYDEFRLNFWSSYQREAFPACIFQPTNADQVAVALLLTRWSQCPFAVRSGGHAAMKEASSVTGGITIDLGQLNNLELTEDKSIAKAGTGNTWMKVYTTVEKDGLAVVGGRVQDIGVGGFTLGGGISFFANSRGWGCDNVANYELVTAAGNILHVNYTSYPDLYRSLRGGGSNFGVVTRFDLETFEQGEISAGGLIYDYFSKHKEITNAFVSFTTKSEQDPDTANWLILLHSPENGGTDILHVLAFHKNPNPPPDSFREFESLEPLMDTRKVRSLADMVLEISETSPQGLREMYWQHTFRFDGEFIHWLTEMFQKELDPIRAKIEGHTIFIPMQVVTKTAVKQMQRNGGNVLPFVEDEAPYIVISYSAMWAKDTQEDEDQVVGLCARVMTKAAEEGKRRGIFVPYVYMNYGSEYQDVMAGYTPETLKGMKAVATTVDPLGVFQTLRSGYFKFGGAPRQNGPGNLQRGRREHEEL